MQFLSIASKHLFHDILPEMANVLAYSRIVNYLSFYSSFNGDYQYYSPALCSQKYLQRYFSAASLESIARHNYEHILTKALVAIHFQEHVMDSKGADRFLYDLYQLSTIQKQDITQSLLKIKCRPIFEGEAIAAAAKLLPVEKRRNIYVVYSRTLPEIQQLRNIILSNPFYKLINTNKVLVFQKSAETRLHLPEDIESFCNENGVKIKLFEEGKGQCLQKIVEYLYSKNKNKILIHQNINFQKGIYQRKETSQTALKARQSSRFMPQQILLMVQRLPFESLANKQNKSIVISRLREILGLESKEDLIDPINRLALDNLDSSYKYQDIQKPKESSLGFSVKRFVTPEIYELNRKQQGLQVDLLSTTLSPTLPKSVLYDFKGHYKFICKNAQPFDQAVSQLGYFYSVHGRDEPQKEQNLSFHWSFRDEQFDIFCQIATIISLFFLLKIYQAKAHNYRSYSQFDFSAAPRASLINKSIQVDIQESRRFCNFLKDDLGENTLGSLKLDLSTTVSKFDKTFKLSKNNDEERSAALNKDCDRLREASGQLKREAELIRQKLDRCEAMMGLYSGKEKHKV